MRVIVVGQGYVGLPLAVRAAEAGHDVVAYDLDRQRVDRLLRAESYVDDVSDADLASALASGRFLPSADVSDCVGFGVAVIAVPTPLRDGTPDLSFIVSAGTALGPLVTPGCCVVLESTTYPGTTEEVLAPLLAELSGLTPGIDFFVGYSPERIDPGNVRWSLQNTPKLVAGINDESLGEVVAFYSSIVEHCVPTSSVKVAELAKLVENTFRHVNVALVNELAVFASELDINIWEAVDAASTKPFGFMPFTPGPGVGGHCLPIDPVYLSWQVRRQLGHAFRFVELASDVNDHMPDYVVRRIALALNRQGHAVRGSRVLQLGLAYKRNSRDARESPAVRVGELLVELGADLHIADPVVTESLPHLDAYRVDATREELDQAHLIVILTDHDAFDWDSIEQAGVPIFDTRNRVKAEHVELL